MDRVHSKLSPAGGGHQLGRPAVGGRQVFTAHMQQSNATI